MEKVKLSLIAVVILLWNYSVAEEYMTTGSRVQIVALSALLSAFSGVAWCYGVWFYIVSKQREKRGVSCIAFRFLHPVLPLYLFGLPLLGGGIISVRFIVSALILWAIFLRPEKMYRLVWNKRFHFAQRFPDSGVVDEIAYNKLGSLIAGLFVGVPLLGMLLLQSLAGLI